MIRSVAALLAKKTAIVAITGVTVIGGATLALALEEVGTEDVAVEVDDTTTTTTEVEDTTTTTTESTTTTTEVEAGECDDVEAGPEADDTTEDQAIAGDGPAEDGACEDGQTSDEETVTDDPEAAVDGTEDGGELEGEHPENHGKHVSEAAKGGGPCADLEAGGFENKGQCVSEVARSDAGKPAPEAPTEEPAVEQAEPTRAEKPATGNGNRGGGGGKGKKG